jgi:hypothetical protein
LTIEWFIKKLQAGRCERTGIAFEYQPNSPWIASPDRIDSDQGYTEPNCQMTVWCYNQAKNNCSDESFLTLCRAVVDYSINPSSN